MEVKRKETIEDKLNKQRINFAGNIRQICEKIVSAGEQAKTNHTEIFLKDEYDTLASRHKMIAEGHDSDSVQLKFPTLDECLRFISIVVIGATCYGIDSHFTFPDVQDLTDNERLSIEFIKLNVEDYQNGKTIQNRKNIIAYTNKAIKLFTIKTYKYWDKIANKELEFFIEYIRGIIPHENYANKLNLIFGKDKNGVPYVSKDIIDSLFQHVQLIIKTCIRFLYYHMNGNSTFFIYDNNETRNVEYEIDLIKEADKWGVKLEKDIF